ncbi:MAG TPA: hypothetical protein HA224_04045 [Nanoarchaeota archaeon]|nr:hypothetical protein [Nanoarchaeota archaeon]
MSIDDVVVSCLKTVKQNTIGRNVSIAAVVEKIREQQIDLQKLSLEITKLIGRAQNRHYVSLSLAIVVGTAGSYFWLNGGHARETAIAGMATASAGIASSYYGTKHRLYIAVRNYLHDARDKAMKKSELWFW